jgi:hypothetical protein
MVPDELAVGTSADSDSPPFHSRATELGDKRLIQAGFERTGPVADILTSV